MAGTNPLETLRIKKLIGFKQITPGVITGNLITALKQCGVDAITGYTQYNSEFSIGQMSVLGNTFYGLKSVTQRTKTSGYMDFNIVNNVAILKAHPVQVGLRLTQSAFISRAANTSMLSFTNRYNISMTPQVTASTEDSSAYYEMVFGITTSSTGNDSIVVQVYVNKQLVSSGNNSVNKDNSVTMRTGNSISPDTDAGFSYLISDMYIAELDYNSDGTVTPQLLGNLTLEPFTVASYTGDKHTNTKNQDIVTALNTLDPNNDLGALAIKPVEQPASVTFSAPDIAGKSILGASLNIVYKDSIAPNNRLNYQITEGTTQLAAETITARNADVTGYTAFSKILTTPEGGGDWNAENLKFKLDIVNNGAE
ncbi:TPA: hypothetical protein O7139_001393 [Salmonella enterica]|nr:hypothetical protein [Salmonella enterica]HDC2559482.1 hypothetical protein [Salmonella enterica]